MPVLRHRDVQVNFRMTEEGKEQLEALREHYGLTVHGLIEMLVRDRALEVGATPKKGKGKKVG